MLERFLNILDVAETNLDYRQIEESLWLSRFLSVAEEREQSYLRPESSPIPIPMTDRTCGKETAPVTTSPKGTTPLKQAFAHGAATVAFGGSTGKQLPASRIRVPAVSSLPRPLEISRALRPLARRANSRREFMLDEERTVEESVRLGLIAPRFKPAPERWFDVALVTDESPSMFVWRDTIDELARLLERNGAFRDVRQYGLRVVSDLARLAIVTGAHASPTPSVGLADPASLTDPAGRRLIIVVTDGVSKHWRDGVLARPLADWAKAMPVVIVQVLSVPLWRHTQLGEPVALIESRLPGQANRALRLLLPAWDLDPVGDRIPIPIVPLADGPIAGWVRMLTSPGSQFGAVVIDPIPSSSASYAKAADLSPRERLVRYKSLVSVEAFDLAVFLSVMPLTWPVMRLVHQAMIPEPKLEHLAEFLAGGIVRRVTAPNSRIEYEFYPGVNQLLERSILRDELDSVFSAVSSLIGRRIGSTREFTAWLRDSDGRDSVAEDALPFGGIAIPALERMGLGYLFEDIEVPRASTSANDPVDKSSIISNPFLHRNKFFVGRRNILIELSRRFLKGHTSQAIIGLGGIGKTSLAIHYGYIHQNSYKYILMIRAHSQESIIHDYSEISKLLKIPASNIQDKEAVAKDTLRWLEQYKDILIIFDHVEDIESVRDFIPRSTSVHVLITSRLRHSGGFATPILLKAFDPKEGALFLLRRLRLIPSKSHLNSAPPNLRTQAEALSDLLGGFPLALDQAATYIENRDLDIAEFIDLYCAAPYKLLNDNTPTSVGKTIFLSFKKVEEESLAAADLLRLCAFLDADNIPEEIFQKGQKNLGPDLARTAANPIDFADAIGVSVAYSLLDRNNAARTNSIHRLAQTVIRDQMNDAQQRLWAERAVRSVISSFPEVEYKTWPNCERLIHHVEKLSTIINEFGFQFPESAELLSRAGAYLKVRGSYRTAEKLLKQSLKVYEMTPVEARPDIFQVLFDLGEIALLFGAYSEAERHYQQCKMIREDAFGLVHPDVANALNKLATVYTRQNRYPEADITFGNCLAVYQNLGMEESAAYAGALNGKGELYLILAKYDEAGSLYEKALTLKEARNDANDPDIAIFRSNLAQVYHKQERYASAIKLCLQSLNVLEKVFGENHVRTTNTRFNLADAYRRLGHFAEAEPLYLRAINVYLEVFGEESPQLVNAYNNLALLYESMSGWEAAEKYYRKALRIYQSQGAMDNPDIAVLLSNLGNLLHAVGRLEEASFFFQKSLKIYNDLSFDMDHPNVLVVLDNYELLKAEMQGFDKEDIA